MSPSKCWGRQGVEPVSKPLFYPSGRIGTLWSAHVSDLELTLDDGGGYYVEVWLTSLANLCWHLPFPQVFPARPQSPCLIITTSLGVLAVLPFPLTNSICEFLLPQNV